MTSKRTHLIKLRLNDAEHQQLQQLRQRGGHRTMAATLRSTLHGASGDEALAEEIGKLGLAINGLRHHCPGSRVNVLADAALRIAERLADKQH